MRYLRGCVHEILERREPFEEPARHQFEVAVTHVVHEVNVDHIYLECNDGSSPGQGACDQWD
jgi:hypothetical protein